MMSRARKSIELIILFAALLAADHYGFTGLAFAQLEPNPYWLPVLAMSLAYGSEMGLAAAAIASVIWVISPHDWPKESDVLAVQLHLSKLPLLWTITALAIGELTASRHSRIAKLQQRDTELAEQSDKIAKVLTRVSKINRDLQVRIATGQYIAGEAITAASGLLVPKQPNQMDALGKLIALVIQTEDFTYYRLQDDRLIPLLRGGCAHEPLQDTSHVPWLDTILSKSIVLHSGQEQSRLLLEGLGIAAVRVKHPKSGSTEAVLIIHFAEWLHLNPTTISEFHHLSQALSSYADVFAKLGLRLADRENFEDKVA